MPDRVRYRGGSAVFVVMSAVPRVHGHAIAVARRSRHQRLRRRVLTAASGTNGSWRTRHRPSNPRILGRRDSDIARRTRGAGEPALLSRFGGAAHWRLGTRRFGQRSTPTERVGIGRDPIRSASVRLAHPLVPEKRRRLQHRPPRQQRARCDRVGLDDRVRPARRGTSERYRERCRRGERG